MVTNMVTNMVTLSPLGKVYQEELGATYHLNPVAAIGFEPHNNRLRNKEIVYVNGLAQDIPTWLSIFNKDKEVE